jgi:ribosomal protein S27AE
MDDPLSILDARFVFSRGRKEYLAVAAGIFLSNMRDSLESSLGVCVVEENSQCPECGKGSMKLIVDTAELTPQAIKTAVRARCTKCGYEDTASVKPQD